MGQIRLFRYDGDGAEELAACLSEYERQLHNLIERHLGEFFGVRLLAHEYSTGRGSRGQIDTLGLDEGGSPVIIEFKRRANENVITQGLYYLDWLLDHQSEFRALVLARLGAEEAEGVDFSWPRIICVASDFNRFDERAVAQIDRSIELVRYRLFGADLILFETVNSPAQPHRDEEREDAGPDCVGMPPMLRQRLNGMNPEIERVYLAALSFVESLGEDVSIRFLKHYIAASRSKVFFSLQPLRNYLRLWLNLDPDEEGVEEGFSRDVRAVGHMGPGSLEVELRCAADLDRARPLIERAYQRD